MSAVDDDSDDLPLPVVVKKKVLTILRFPFDFLFLPLLPVALPLLMAQLLIADVQIRGSSIYSNGRSPSPCCRVDHESCQLDLRPRGSESWLCSLYSTNRMKFFDPSLT